MAAYLVTHSLLSSWLHLIRENPYEDLTTEGDPLAEFMLDRYDGLIIVELGRRADCRHHQRRAVAV